MPPQIPLTGEQIQRLQDALLAAYDFDDLRRMVRTRLGQDLEHVVPVQGRNLTAIVYDLIRYYAVPAGGVQRLLAAALHDKPDNPRLKEVAMDFAGIDFAPLPLPAIDQERRRPSQRIVVASGAFLVAVLVLAGTVWLLWPRLVDWWQGPACAGNPLCAVVARLSVADPAAAPQAAELTAEIAQQIRDVLGPDDPGQALVALVDSVEDNLAARQAAADEGALLVVWGRILEQAGKLRIHFELSDLLGVGAARGVRTLRAEPLLYDPIAGRIVCANCLDISEGELGQRIAVVAHAAAGFLHYADRPELAYADFMAALYCAGEPLAEDLVAAVRPACKQHEPPAEWNPALLHYYAGKAAVLGGNYAAGVDLLRTAAGENSYDPAAPLGIGAAYQEWTGDQDAPAAVAAFAESETRIRALATTALPDADRAALYHDLGLVYELQADWTNAADNYGRAVELFGADQTGAYVSLVRQRHTLGQGGDPVAAKTRLEQAVALDPGAPWAYLELARLAWTDAADRQAAEQWLAKAGQSAAGAAYVPLERAALCVAWEDYACAADAYRAALAARPNSGWLHSQVGAFYLPTDPPRPGQSWEQAAEHFTWAADLRPQDPWAHERLGYVLLNQKQPAAAAAHYARAIALTYDDTAPARLYCSLATAQTRAGEADAARASQAACEQHGGAEGAAP